MKDFATHILEASLNTGDQQLGEKCETLQQKLDLLLQTLSKEENYLSDNVEEIDIGTPNTETLNSNQEKGALEKPEKEMTNLKKVRKKRCYMERDAVMSRYIHNAYYLYYIKEKYIKDILIFFRANSLKRAIRKLVEHTESAVDEHNDPSDEKQSSKMPNITITSDNPSMNTTISKFLIIRIMVLSLFPSISLSLSSTFFSLTCVSIINNLDKKHLDIPGLLQTDQTSDNISLMPTLESGSSIEISPCSSPTPNVASLSPMPDLRRDSQPEELLTLPAPDGFADSRRNSENMPQG